MNGWQEVQGKRTDIFRTFLSPSGKNANTFVINMS